MEKELLKRSASADPLYAPTPFWAAASQRLAEDLAPDRLARFRSLAGPLSFFVPTYGFPGIGLSRDHLEVIADLASSLTPKQAALLGSWTSGRSHAHADYRVFSSVARTHAPQLRAFTESEVGQPVEHHVFEGKRYSRSALNYLLGLCFLAQVTDLSKLVTFLEIGGGFGSLGEIIAQVSQGSGSRYINVDISPTCFFADYYLRHACPDVPIRGVSEFLDHDPIQVSRLPTLNVMPNWAIERVQGHIDVFVNFISFQEMEPDIVKNYLGHVDRLTPRWILLRNMREGKQLRTKDNPVGVDTPIVSGFYQQQLPNYRLVASDAEVFGYTTSDGFHSELLLFERSVA